VTYARKLLQEIGLGEERIQMINLSSAMGGQFAIAAKEITEKIKGLGPNPLKGRNE
jgi:F420-non-reducing hydrogenase iron-sulfur subunit